MRLPRYADIQCDGKAVCAPADRWIIPLLPVHLNCCPAHSSLLRAFRALRALTRSAKLSYMASENSVHPPLLLSPTVDTFIRLVTASKPISISTGYCRLSVHCSARYIYGGPAIACAYRTHAYFRPCPPSSRDNLDDSCSCGLPGFTTSKTPEPQSQLCRSMPTRPSPYKSVSWCSPCQYSAQSHLAC